MKKLIKYMHYFIKYNTVITLGFNVRQVHKSINRNELRNDG